MLKFKTEIGMLLASIFLFVFSAFCFSYAAGANGLNLAIASTYPYRGYAIPFIGFGGALMTVASVSYSKRSRTTVQPNR